MPDKKLRPIHPRRTLIAPMVFGGIVLALLLGAVVWKGRMPPPTTPAAPVVAPAMSPPPATLPLPPPPLGRRQIVDAAGLAASAYADGVAPDPKADAELVGRAFSLRIPFGCEGPQVGAGAAQAYFEVDPERRTNKLVARPGDWTALPAIPRTPGAKEIEDVEGFWLPRPWSFVETCPPRRDMPVPATPAPVAAQSVGLAQVFEAGGSRLLRRDGRAYEFTRKAAADQPAALATSYRLVLEGRVVGFRDGRAIHCWSETPDHHPICLFGVEFDRVAFEDAAGQLLSEWRD